MQLRCGHRWGAGVQVESKLRPVSLAIGTAVHRMSASVHELSGANVSYTQDRQHAASIALQTAMINLFQLLL